MKRLHEIVLSQALANPLALTVESYWNTYAFDPGWSHVTT